MRLDGGRVVGGVAILLSVAAGPAWMGSAHGVRIAGPATPRGSAGCVEARDDMRKNHPALLARWREQAVRLGERVQRTADGRRLPIDLTETCLGCHGTASDFCERCHAQVAVTLSCWQCHAQSARATSAATSPTNLGLPMDLASESESSRR
jgi:hypothetical protein